MLLKSKEYAEHLESLETRIARVTDFLKLFRPTLKQYEVVPLTDVYGPTATDGNIQALVVSQETYSGAEAGMLTFSLFCHDIQLLITFISR
jgi:pantetheine-phosphate adenylyltransferase